MVEVNYQSKPSKVSRLIKQWKWSNFTTVGISTVIKTLIIPKPHHLILCIPNSSVEYLQKFGKEIYYFYGRQEQLGKGFLDYRCLGGGGNCLCNQIYMDKKTTCTPL